MADDRFSQADYADHVRTYRYFVRGVTLFAAHVLLILIILAYATMM